MNYSEFYNFAQKVSAELYEVYHTREISKEHLQNYIKYRDDALKRLIKTNGGNLVSEFLGRDAVRKYCDEGMTAQMHEKGFIYFDYDPVPVRKRTHNKYLEDAIAILFDEFLEEDTTTYEAYASYKGAANLVQNVVMFKHPHYVGKDLANYIKDYVNLGFVP